MSYATGKVPEEEFQRCKQLILIKARRYRPNPGGDRLVSVEVSTRLVTGMVPEQLERLRAELSVAGYKIDWLDQTSYSERISQLRHSGPRRFGAAPPNSAVNNSPKGPDWANG